MKLPVLLLLFLAVACAAPQNATKPEPPAVKASTGPALKVDPISFEELGEYITAHGQVQNISRADLEFVKVTLVIYDNQNNFLSSETGFLELTTLPPGQKSTYSITLRQPSKKWRYEVRFADRDGKPLNTISTSQN